MNHKYLDPRIRKYFGVINYHIRRSHVFKREQPNSHDLAAELSKNAYRYEGIIVLNKPQGISFSNPSFSESSKGKNVDADYEVSLATLLPYLKKTLDAPSLHLVKAPEKYTSGVSIFSTNEDLSVNLKKQLLNMRELRQPSDTFLALTLGKPQHDESLFNGAITLKTRQNSKQKKVMIENNWSKNSVQKGITKRVTIMHRTLQSNEDVSLIEISSTRNNWHCIRMYLASRLLTPILGDNLFGSQVKTILGMPVLLDVFSQVAQEPQKLPNKILAQLELSSRKDVSVPLHLHLSRVTVNNFMKKGNNVSFEAPLSNNFVWACEKLGLCGNKLLLK